MWKNNKNLLCYLFYIFKFYFLYLFKIVCFLLFPKNKKLKKKALRMIQNNNDKRRIEIEKETVMMSDENGFCQNKIPNGYVFANRLEDDEEDTDQTDNPMLSQGTKTREFPYSTSDFNTSLSQLISSLHDETGALTMKLLFVCKKSHDLLMSIRMEEYWKVKKLNFYEKTKNETVYIDPKTLLKDRKSSLDHLVNFLTQYAFRTNTNFSKTVQRRQY